MQKNRLPSLAHYFGVIFVESDVFDVFFTFLSEQIRLQTHHHNHHHQVIVGKNLN